VAFDAFGNLFVCYLLTNGNTVVLLSADKGYSFSTNKVFTNGCDHPELATGPGCVWVAFYDYSAKSSFVSGAAVSGLEARSHGSIRSQLSRILAGYRSDDGYGQGDIAVGPTGQVAVVVQNSGACTNCANQIRISVNSHGLNQATNFSSAVSVLTTDVGFMQPLPAQPNRGITPTPGLAWDRTGGRYKGRLYLTYSDSSNTGSTNTNIYVTHSDDNGSTWTNTVKINTDSTTTSQFFPRIAVDQASGKVAVSWYDCRDDTANVKTKFYAAVSSDGGVTFSPNNFRVETGQSDITGPDFNGWTIEYYDYTGLAFYGGHFFAAWADHSNVTGGNQDGGMGIYIAKVQY
jgi:hypothetical protein